MAQRRKPGADPDPKPAVVAAAKRLDLEGKEQNGYRRKAKSEVWQREAWTYFDILGEVKQPTYFLANTCSLARIYVATQPDPEQDPSAITPGAPGAFEAQDAIDRLRTGAKGGIPGLTRNSSVNAKVAGEWYLVGFPPVAEILPGGKDENGKVLKDGRAPEPERFAICSVSQVESKGEGRGMEYTYREDPGDTTGKAFPPGALVIRMWQEHPEYPELADCALRALLGECEELLILSRGVKASGRSRLAGAGLLLWPSEAIPQPTPQPGTEEDPENEKPFDEVLMEAMVTPIANEGDASAVVPLFVKMAGDYIDKVKHLTFDRALDPLALEQRRELIQRIGQGSDVPIEILVGLKNVNHWTAYQVDQSTWDRYGHPTMLLWVESLTVGYLRPLMEEAGISPEVAQQYMVWFDPAGAVTQPDRTSTVMEALDRFIISWQAARSILGFSEADAPTDEEIAQRIEIAVAMKGGQGDKADGSNPSGGGAPNEGNPPNSPNARTNADGDVLDMLHTYMTLNGGRLPPGLVAAAAARRQPLGRRLMRIDRTLRTRLLEAADASLLRTLERAGARLRNRAKRNPATAAAIAKVAAWQVPSRLGPGMTEALKFTEDELLADSFDEFGPKFLSRVADAQGEALDAMAADLNLDEDEIASLRRVQQQDRNDAWAWLSAALVGLATQRLYNPAPEAPARGEYDVSGSVPAGLIREAMARAGGAAAGPHPDRPAGGVAVGDLVLDVFARHGQVVDGWEWVYGDPSSRTQPFEPHEELDGVQFSTWQDDVLLIQAGDEWLDTGDGYYRPGDHLGCQCDFIPLGLGSDESSGDESADEEAPADTAA